MPVGMEVGKTKVIEYGSQKPTKGAFRAPGSLPLATEEVIKAIRTEMASRAGSEGTRSEGKMPSSSCDLHHQMHKHNKRRDSTSGV